MVDADAPAVEDGADHFVDVHRVVHRHAHAAIRHRPGVGPAELVLGVELVRVVQELDRPHARCGGEEEPRVVGDDGGEMRRNVHRDVDLAVLEGGDSYRVVGNGLEGTGAHRVPRHVRGVLLAVILGRQDRGPVPGHQRVEDRPGCLGVDAHGERVYHLDVADRHEGRRSAELELGVDEPLQAELARGRIAA